MKYMAHPQTTEYVNRLLVNNFVPTIVMPTRINDKSATLIDHMYYFEGSNCKHNLTVTSGNLWSDMTDHLPNYILISKPHAEITTSSRPVIRVYSRKNIDKFVTEVHNESWNEILHSTNVNDCYDMFDRKLSSCFNSSFKPVQISRARIKDTCWITPGIRTSSRTKKTNYLKSGV